MDDQTRQGRDIQIAIGKALLSRWDPLMLGDQPEARHEYDEYVGGVYRLLAEGASDKVIAQHLTQVETSALGFEDTDWKYLVPVAHKLRKVYRRLVPDSHAT